MTDLTTKRCRACEGDVDKLSDEQIRDYLQQVEGWDRSDDTITRTFSFENYYQTTAFVNAVAWIAHCEDHHPDIAFGYKNARISFSTHSVGGLTENDFICAAKIDALLPRGE